MSLSKFKMVKLTDADTSHDVCSEKAQVLYTSSLRITVSDVNFPIFF